MNLLSTLEQPVSSSETDNTHLTSLIKEKPWEKQQKRKMQKAGL